MLTENFINSEPDKWNESLSGEMSLENIRQLYKPDYHYRVSWNSYSSGTDFTGWSRNRRLYIIKGSCIVTVKDHHICIYAGESADLPEGDFHFRASSDSDIELVSVWELPEAFRTKPDTF